MHAGPAYLGGDRAVLALAEQSGNARLLDLNSGENLASWQFPGALAVMKLTFSHDGSLLGAWGVSEAWSGYAVWDLAEGKQSAWYWGGDWAAFSPEGRRLAVPLSEIGLVRYSLLVTSLDGGTPDQRLNLLSEGSVAFAPDGRWLAVGLWQGVASLLGGYPPDIYNQQANGVLFFDAQTWERRGFLPLPYGVSRLACAPGGMWLLK